MITAEPTTMPTATTKIQPPTHAEFRACYDGPESQETIDRCLSLADRVDAYGAQEHVAYVRAIDGVSGLRRDEARRESEALRVTAPRHHDNWTWALAAAGTLRREAAVIMARIPTRIPVSATEK